MANCITCIRIICSIGLLFCPPLSISFYALFVVAGITDMIDGAVARKLGTAGAFGAGLDTIADLLFVVVCAVRLLPVLHLEAWFLVWTGIIAVIKAAGIVSGFVLRKELVTVHSLMNKITGAMLFVFPLTLHFVCVRYSASVICAVASVAAIHEAYMILKIITTETGSSEKEGE